MMKTDAQRQKPRRRGAWLVWTLLVAGAPASAAVSEPDPAGDASRGRVLAALGSCGACHGAPDQEGPYAGGYAIETPQGTFFGPNLTPDPVAGIGAWEFADFRRAMLQGRSPTGQRYWPAFPYPSYTRLRDEDLADLWAYLQTLPPSPRPNTPHALGGRKRFPSVLLWRLLYFRSGPHRDDPARSTAWNRGAYLGEGIGHCGECHTPRNRHGATRNTARLTGHSQPPEPAPDITQQRLGAWSLADTVSFFEDGMTPEGDIVGGEMARIVTKGTSQLLPSERKALAAWLLSIGSPPTPPPASEETEETEKEVWE